MKKSKPQVQLILVAAILIWLIGGVLANFCLADPTSTASPPDANTAPVKRQLSGAELYSIHCNRCHPERYPTERTAAQWKTILLHMEVRANLPRSQSKLILKYLQENSGR